MTNNPTVWTMIARMKFDKCPDVTDAECHKFWNNGPILFFFSCDNLKIICIHISHMYLPTILQRDPTIGTARRLPRNVSTKLQSLVHVVQLVQRNISISEPYRSSWRNFWFMFWSSLPAPWAKRLLGSRPLPKWGSSFGGSFHIFFHPGLVSKNQLFNRRWFQLFFVWCSNTVLGKCAWPPCLHPRANKLLAWLAQVLRGGQCQSKWPLWAICGTA